VRVLTVSSCLLALWGGDILGQIPVERLNLESGQYRLLSSQLVLSTMAICSLPRRSELIVAVICIIASLILGPIRDVVLIPNL
jgi:hypothetical protein